VIEAGAAHEIVGVTVCGVDTPPPGPEEQPIREIPAVRASALSRLIEYKIPPQDLQKFGIAGKLGRQRAWGVVTDGGEKRSSPRKLNRFTVKTSTGRDQPLSRRISGAAANSEKSSPFPQDL
jgi:hypothetical protein